jgi:hypothetical protein
MPRRKPGATFRGNEIISAMFDYPAALLVIAPLIILVGYVVYGLGGFGSAIVVGPVLAHFLPLTFVVP